VPQLDPADPTGQTMTRFIPPIGDDNKIEVNWERFYQAIEEWSVTIDVSLTPDQLKDEKRSDLQDMLTVLAQNAQNIPGAQQKIEELTNMLMQDAAPLVAAGSSGNVPPAHQVTAPMPAAAPQTAQPTGATPATPPATPAQ
jgi:hypothetical protein